MDCVFCDRTQFEERLCGETKDFWIIATLGQITDGGYVLLVPKRHVECIGGMRKKEIWDLFYLARRVEEAQRNIYRIHSSTIFEHGIVGQTVKHAHLHLIPHEPHYLYVEDRIEKDFPNCKLDYLPPEKLIKLYRLRKTAYLYYRQPAWIDFPSGGFKVCWNPSAPPQYLRTIVAEALGRPERANWRNMDPELDKKLWLETVRRLKPYFS